MHRIAVMFMIAVTARVTLTIVIRTAEGFPALGWGGRGGLRMLLAFPLPALTFGPHGLFTLFVFPSLHFIPLMLMFTAHHVAALVFPLHLYLTGAFLFLAEHAVALHAFLFGPDGLLALETLAVFAQNFFPLHPLTFHAG